MFTGLIEEIGTIARVQRGARDLRLAIRSALPLEAVALGESIAVNGACLTVTHKEADTFWADLSVETLAATTFGERRVGDRLHLERALRLGDRLGGHLVQGHVDGVGVLRERGQEGEAWQLLVEASPDLVQQLIPKGSVAVDGVSLTVNDLGADHFRLTIVPFTAGHTLLTEYPVGRRVQIETDMLGKYVRRALEGLSTSHEGSSARLSALLEGFLAPQR